jgi:magnesium-transporting ATPase (P-type)
MGGANNICSDKTGTLTKNQMTLTTMWSKTLHKIDTYSETLSMPEQLPPCPQLLELIRLNMCVNSNADLFPD